MKIVVLLTGTINPGQMGLTRLLNPEDRRKQYVTSINFWLTTTSLPIVFVENSNSDISVSFQHEIAAGRLEVLTFSGNDYPTHLGKGIGEMNCMQYAHQYSQFINQAEFIFKVTGRHQLLNFNAYYKHLLQHSYDVTADLKANISFADSRFWGYKTDFFRKYLIVYQEMLNDSEGYFFEHALNKAVLHAIADGMQYSPFRYAPRIKGMSGTFNESYNSSYLLWLPKNLLKRLKYYLIGR